MADDEDQVCGCLIFLGIIYGLYHGVIWAVDKYSLEAVAIITGSILSIIIISTVVSKILKEAKNLNEKGKLFIKFGFIWFVFILFISVILDHLMTLTDIRNRGIYIFLGTLVVNMPGTFILFYIGARKLKLCDIESQVMEGRKIMYFGIFWFFFWIVSPYIFTYLNIMKVEGIKSSFLLLVAIPGTIVDMIIGNWSKKIDTSKGWKDLDRAQKSFDKEKARLNEQKNQIVRETSELYELKEQLSRERKALKKENKELQQIKNDADNKIKALEGQQKEINKARIELESTWNQLKDTIDKNPFRMFIKEKLNTDIFVKEIEEFKKVRPGDISSIRTSADSAILDIHEELKKEISTIEDEYYLKAFYEHFKKSNGDLAEYDRIRTRYNPTIHVKVDRRNKEWAEKRRFELSKIEKSMREEMSMKTGK